MIDYEGVPAAFRRRLFAQVRA